MGLALVGGSGHCHTATEMLESAKFWCRFTLFVTLFWVFVTQCVAVFLVIFAQTMHCTAWSMQSQNGVKRAMQSHFFLILGCRAAMQCLDGAVQGVYMGLVDRRERMAEQVILKVSGVSPDEWVRCQKVAKMFMDQYPDRMGFRDGCVYVPDDVEYETLYVYRTKTSVVVRGSREVSE